MLTRDKKLHGAADKLAVIGTYGATSRRKMLMRDRDDSDDDADDEDGRRFVQVQRMGNPLINELLIGTESKDRFSMADPKDDQQFAAFFLNPLLAGIFGSIGIPVPARHNRPVAARTIYGSDLPRLRPERRWPDRRSIAS